MKNPDVVWWANLGIGNVDHSPDNPVFDYRLLADGNSWFFLGGIPTSNLLFFNEVQLHGNHCQLQQSGGHDQAHGTNSG